MCKRLGEYAGGQREGRKDTEGGRIKGQNDAWSGVWTGGARRRGGECSPSHGTHVFLLRWCLPAPSSLRKLPSPGRGPDWARVSAQVDMFSYGMVLYELLSGQRPALGHHQLQIAKKLSKGVRPVLGPPEEVQFHRLQALMVECWDTQPEKVPWEARAAPAQRVSSTYGRPPARTEGLEGPGRAFSARLF